MSSKNYSIATSADEVRSFLIDNNIQEVPELALIDGLAGEYECVVTFPNATLTRVFTICFKASDISIVDVELMIHELSRLHAHMIVAEPPLTTRLYHLPQG